MFQEALGRVAASVAVVTTAHDATPVGCTVSSVVSVSLQPPLLSICLDTQRFLSAAVLRHGAFAVNVLSDDQEELAIRFAGMSPPASTTTSPDDRFEGLGWSWAADVPVLGGTVARLCCRLWASYDGGDHRILVGEVVSARGWTDRRPLLRFDRGWGRVAPGTISRAERGSARVDALRAPAGSRGGPV